MVLDPSNLTNVYGSTMEGNYLNLSKKEVPKDNTEVQVSLGAAQWQGQGSEQDPSSWSVTVDRFTDRMTVRAAHEEAVITCNGEAYTGEMTVELPYDESIWNFSVASADGSAVQFYQVSVTREKYEPLAPSGLTAVPPSSVGGNDGKIQGLDEKKKYEYRSKGESTYHPVAEGSKEITGLTAGTYLFAFRKHGKMRPAATGLSPLRSRFLTTFFFRKRIFRQESRSWNALGRWWRGGSLLSA